MNCIAPFLSPCALIAMCLSFAVPASAQSSPASDSAAVVAVVQRLLDAMASRDTATARALLVPGSRVISLRPGSANATPRVQTDSAFIRSLAAPREALLERMWSPAVRIHAGLAELWAPYDFHLGGRFSHCGVDSFTLMRGASGWQIVGIAYTVETAGCAPSPLGPPK